MYTFSNLFTQCLHGRLGGVVVINEALLSTGESCAGLAASALWTVTPCIGRRHVGHVGVQTSCERVVVGAVLCVLYCVITVTTD